MVAICFYIVVSSIWCINAGLAIHTAGIEDGFQAADPVNAHVAENGTDIEPELHMSIPETLQNEDPAPQQDPIVVRDGEERSAAVTPGVQEEATIPSEQPVDPEANNEYHNATGDAHEPHANVEHPVAPAEAKEDGADVTPVAQHVEAAHNTEPPNDASDPATVPEDTVLTEPAHDGGNKDEEVPPPIPQTPLPNENDEAQAGIDNNTTAEDAVMNSAPIDEPVDVGETMGSSEGHAVEANSVDTTSTPTAPVLPQLGTTYDPNDIQKGNDATKLDIGDVLESGKDKMSNLTMGIDQEWLNKEREVSSIQEKMPTGTGFTYNRSAKVLTPVVDKPRIMGGVLQTLIDKEAEIRRRYEYGVQIEHDLRLRVSRETADVIGLLTKSSMDELKKKHPLVFTRLVEPLKASVAISHLNKSADQIIRAYDKNWYVKATAKDKEQLLKNIRKDTARPDLFIPKIKKPKNMTPKKRKIYDVLDEYYNDYQCQKIIRGNQVAKQMLRMFDEQSGLYVAPFYTDVVPTLGSLWMIARFERFFKQAEVLRGDILAKALPQMVGRFMVMIENGTLLATSPELQVTLYSLSAVLSRIMNGVTEPTIFLGKKKYYGFMGLCNVKCAKGILTDIPKGDISRSFVLNKQREILRWISLYLRDDLLRIETMVQKLLLEIMFRTTNERKYLLSARSVDLHLTSEYAKDVGETMLEIPHHISTVTPMLTKLDVLAKRFMSGFRRFGKKVNNREGYNAITPYNAFKTPNKVVVSLDDGLLNMIEVVTDMVNMNIGGDVNNLYFQAFNTWVQLQTYHNAIHSFEPLSSKNKNSSKTMGAIFRFLNMSTTGHIQSIPQQFLPFTSLILQMSFYLQNSVEGYERTKTRTVKNFLRGVATLSLKGKMGPKSFDQLYAYFQPHVIYNKAKYKIGRAIVGDMVKKFKEMFLAKPAIPTPIIQLISVFLGLWTKASHPVLELNNPQIDRVRKSFFLSYISNRSGMSEVAADIAMKHCSPATKILHLGCVSKYGAKGTVCKQVSIRMVKADVLKAMQLLDATFDDPLDIIRVGSDIARRCKAMTARKGVQNDKLPSHVDRLLLFSEMAQRYHCYSAQKMAANQLLKALLRNKSSMPAEDVINQVFSGMRTISVKQSDMKGTEQNLICPFMDDAPQETRERHRRRIVEYVKTKLTLRRKLATGVKKLIKKLLLEESRSLPPPSVLEEIPGCIIVGTRKFDGIMFYAGYAPPEKIHVPENIQLNPGDGRLVYDGKVFTSELEALNATSAVTAITMEKKGGITRRLYHLESGGTLDELKFGLDANDFVVRAHVLTTAGALSIMGYNIGRFIWCGYEHGWVVDFALQDVIANTDVPVFNGRYWVLSKLLRVADVVGQKVNIKNGEQIADKNIGEVNIDVYSGDGDQIAKYPSNAGDASSFIKHGSEATFTFDTGYGEVSPAAIQDLVRNAEFDPVSNTLVINLDAPGAVLQASPIVSRT